TYTATPTRVRTATSPPTPILPPTITPSPTVTPTPAAASVLPTSTLSPFPFIVQRGTPRIRDNYLNGAGCDWLGVVGTTITNTGDHVQDIDVRVWSEDGTLVATTTSGDAPIYGASGWEVQLGDAPAVGRYSVGLWANDIALSEPVSFLLQGTCESNLAKINFVRIRPY
ncbi:MAG: hypothetical protein GYB65_24110, partial [Chloroflexi bacterium]|nr:hypothetical protein [Chloroflexota bacterium]